MLRAYTRPSSQLSAVFSPQTNSFRFLKPCKAARAFFRLTSRFGERGEMLRNDTQLVIKYLSMVAGRIGFHLLKYFDGPLLKMSTEGCTALIRAASHYRLLVGVTSIPEKGRSASSKPRNWAPANAMEGLPVVIADSGRCGRVAKAESC